MLLLNELFHFVDRCVSARWRCRLSINTHIRQHIRKRNHGFSWCLWVSNDCYHTFFLDLRLLRYYGSVSDSTLTHTHGHTRAHAQTHIWWCIIPFLYDDTIKDCNAECVFMEYVTSKAILGQTSESTRIWNGVQCIQIGIICNLM